MLRGIALPALALLGGLVIAPPARALPGSSALGVTNPELMRQDGTRPDQIHVQNARTGRRSVVNGTIVENTLTTVRVDQDGKETRLDALEVERIQWGTVSPAFREAQTYFTRGDYENAAARFRQATDVDERPVVKAFARARAGESLLRLGATDPSQYAEALNEFQRFLSSYPSDRAVPKVRRMQARATRLAGNAAAAGALYRSLFEEGAGAATAPGYDRLLCLHAGLEAAESMTTAGDTLAAREILGALKSGVAAMQAQVQANSAASEELAALAAEADLGEGFVLIASGQHAQAETFFQSRLQSADSAGATTRFGAMLGLAEAYSAGRKHSEARILFARVVAIDFTNRDRTAHALLRLAQSTLELKEPDANQRAQKWITELLESYGDTPSAAAARGMTE